MLSNMLLILLFLISQAERMSLDNSQGFTIRLPAWLTPAIRLCLEQMRLTEELKVVRQCPLYPHTVPIARYLVPCPCC